MKNFTLHRVTTKFITLQSALAISQMLKSFFYAGNSYVTFDPGGDVF